MVRALGLSVVALLVSCAHSDELSVAEHRKLAAEEQARGQRDATRAQAMGPVPTDPSPVVYEGKVQQPFSVVSAPQLVLQDQAAAELAHARAHEDAAKALEDFEDQACRGVSPEARRACPLLTPYVWRVVETDSGLQLYLKKEAPAAQIEQRMRCHLAFARARGYRDVPPCALYLPGVEMTVAPGHQWIELSVRGAQRAAELRGRARDVLGVRVATQTP